MPEQNSTTVTELPAGRELDRLVAEKVMGGKLRLGREWEVNDAPPAQRWLCELSNGECFEFEPSTDIAAAWEVVEKLPKPIMLLRRNDGTWLVDTDACECGGHGPAAEAETAPLAICRAALKLRSGAPQNSRAGHPWLT